MVNVPVPGFQLADKPAFRMPAMTEQQLFYNLPYEFRDFLTEEKSKYFFDYAVRCIVNDETGHPKEMELFACAILKTTVEGYRAMLHRAGFRLRAVGCNLTASRFNGIPVKRFMLASFIVSGAIAGLGGGAELLGTQFRLINGYGAGYGFDGVAMALIGQLHPIATMVVALFFAVLRVGSTTMQAATGVPTSVSDIIQALVIVFSVAGMALTKLPEFQAWRSRVFHGRKACEA